MWIVGIILIFLVNNSVENFFQRDFEYWVNPLCDEQECLGLVSRDAVDGFEIGECKTDFPHNSGHFWCYVKAKSPCPKYPSPRCRRCYYSYVPCSVKAAKEAAERLAMMEEYAEYYYDEDDDVEEEIVEKETIENGDATK